MTPTDDEYERPTNRPHRSRSVEHWVWLVLCSAVIVAACLLEVRGTDQVGCSLGPGFVLPQLCAFRGFLGVNCPGCGMTRSFIYLAHGNWQASWEMHRLGFLFALAVVAQVPYRIYRLCRPGRIRFPHRLMNVLGYGLGGAMLINWMLALALAN